MVFGFPPVPASGGSAIKKDANGNVDVRLFARDGSPTNFNVDNTIKRSADPNKPVYKPEFLQKIKIWTITKPAEDPLFFCKPAGVPRSAPRTRFRRLPARSSFSTSPATRFA